MSSLVRYSAAEAVSSAAVVPQAASPAIMNAASAAANAFFTLPALFSFFEFLVFIIFDSVPVFNMISGILPSMIFIFRMDDKRGSLNQPKKPDKLSGFPYLPSLLFSYACLVMNSLTLL